LAVGLPGKIEAVYIHSLEGLDPVLTGKRLQEVEQLVFEDGENKLAGGKNSRSRWTRWQKTSKPI
jgi:hypothetical protein